MVFVLLYLIFSDTYHFSRPLSSFESLFSFQLTGLPYTLLRDLILIVPYIVLLFILIMVFLHFSNLIKTRSIRRSLKFISLFLLLSGPIFLVNAIVNPPPIDYNISPQKTTTTNTTTTTTTDVNTTYSTGSNSNTKTSSDINSKNGPSTGSGNPLVVNPNINQGLFNILIFLALLLLLGFFIRSLQSTRNLDIGDKNLNSNLKEFSRQDSIREFIIREYLQLSQELEMKGINPDFSLTPMEFEDETVLNLNIDEIRKITFYYELARFSKRPITQAELEDFTAILKDLYERLQLLNQNLDKID